MVNRDKPSLSRSSSKFECTDIANIIGLFYYLKNYCNTSKLRDNNCDLKKARFFKIRFFDDVIYGANLASAFIFLDDFWQMSSKCIANFSLSSKFIPNNFSDKAFFMCELPIFQGVCSLIFRSR